MVRVSDESRIAHPLDLYFGCCMLNAAWRVVGCEVDAKFGACSDERPRTDHKNPLGPRTASYQTMSLEKR